MKRQQQASELVLLLTCISGCWSYDVDYPAPRTCEDKIEEYAELAQRGVEVVRATAVDRAIRLANSHDFPVMECEEFHPEIDVSYVVVEEAFREDADYGEGELAVAAPNPRMGGPNFYAFVIDEPLTVIEGDVIEYRVVLLDVLADDPECSERLSEELRSIWANGEYGERAQPDRFLGSWQDTLMRTVYNTDDPAAPCFVGGE